MNNTLTTVLAIAIIVGGASFWGGMTYAQSQTPARQGQFAAGNFAGLGGGQGGANRAFRAGGNGAFGTIIAKDATSITVQLTAGPNATPTNGINTGTKIVLFDTNTNIQKTVAGTPSDLTVGQSVVANGSSNSDGSITAQTIQIRTAGSERLPS